MSEGGSPILAGDGIPVIDMCEVRAALRPGSSCSSSSSSSSSSSGDSVGCQLRTALSQFGCLHLVNHGFESEVEEMLAHSAAFFRLKKRFKRAVSMKQSSAKLGYALDRVGVEATHRERLHCGWPEVAVVEGGSRQLLGRNQWVDAEGSRRIARAVGTGAVDGGKDFRDVCSAFVAMITRQVALPLLRLLSVVMGWDRPPHCTFIDSLLLPPSTKPPAAAEAKEGEEGEEGEEGTAVGTVLFKLLHYFHETREQAQERVVARSGEKCVSSSSSSNSGSGSNSSSNSNSGSGSGSGSGNGSGSSVPAVVPQVATHCDFSLLTILAENSSPATFLPGLEVQARDPAAREEAQGGDKHSSSGGGGGGGTGSKRGGNGDDSMHGGGARWLQVVPERPGALFVHCGELLGVLSGGALHAVPHRVYVRDCSAARPSRHSLGVFLNPHPEATLVHPAPAAVPAAVPAMDAPPSRKRPNRVDDGCEEKGDSGGGAADESLGEAHEANEAHVHRVFAVGSSLEGCAPFRFQDAEMLRKIGTAGTGLGPRTGRFWCQYCCRDLAPSMPAYIETVLRGCGGSGTGGKGEGEEAYTASAEVPG